MPGPGQESQLINVPQTPLVTPAAPSAAVPSGQAAVDAMVNAFRQGQITSEDLVDRFGMAGRAKTQLATAQAEAALPLVEPTAQLQQAKTAAELAQTNWGQSSLKTAQETMGWFGDSIENYKLPNGQTDFQKLAKVGAQRTAQLAQVDSWANMLKPVSTRTIKLGDGTEKVQYLNSLNQDVTPPSDGYDGSEQYWHYITQLQAYMPSEHPLGRIYPMKYDPTLKKYDPRNSTASPAPHPTGAVVPPAVQTNPLGLGPYPEYNQVTGEVRGVTQESPQVGKMRAELINQGKTSQEVDAMTPEQVVASSPVASVISAAAGSTPAQPAITPIASPVQAATPVIMPRPVPGTGGITITYALQTVFTAEKIREGLLKESPYKNWQETIPYATTFETNARQVKSLTPEQQRNTNMNVTDLGLAESIIKMYDPTGTIREFKWEKFEKNQPLASRLKNWQSELLKNGTFTPETRSELIRMGEDVIKGREDAAKPFIHKALAQVQSNPRIDPATVFTSEDDRVAASRAASETPTAAPAAGIPTNSPGPGWVQITLPGLGRIWRKSGSNQFIPVK